jgi:hypothetical protein
VFQVNLKRVQSPVRAGTLFICVVFGACLPEREFTNKLITTRGNARNGADTYFWCIWAPVKDELNLELTLEEIGGLHLKLPLPYCLFQAVRDALSSGNHEAKYDCVRWPSTWSNQGTS